jgi:cellulose biosynthesis protein BcsQ
VKTTSPCRFDDSLPRMVGQLASALGREELENGVILRDASGRLTFFSKAAPSGDLEKLSSELTTSLGAYAHPDRVIVANDDPSTAVILQHPDIRTTEVAHGDDSYRIRYLDRRIVGADWLRPAPDDLAEKASASPRAIRIAFSSLKGGVGRSTALTVVATEQARKGRNVLVVDLDLEAPGIGSLLLSEDRLPSFGIVDYLVERNFDRADRALLQEMVGVSSLTKGQGLVHVAPAIGQRSLQSPQNYLGKLSRAMLEAVSAEGDSLPLAGKLEEMLTELEALNRYDLVLLDVRAGLAELTAGPLLALGAEILIFATAQRQSLQDLSFLFAHLATVTESNEGALRDRLKMVHAKASSVEGAQRFRGDLWELFSKHLYEEASSLNEFNFDVNDPTAPHHPLLVPLDLAFADWDPVHQPDRLVDTYYSRTFSELISYVEDLVMAEQADGEE